MTPAEVDARCVFCDIVSGVAAASVVYRDDTCIAFMDIRPVNAGHLLVVPLEHAPYLEDLPSTSGERLFSVAQRLAAGIRRSGLQADGINFFLADGVAAGQEVFHVHLHVFPRFEHDGFGLTFSQGYGQPVERSRLDREASAIAAALSTA